MKISAQKMKKNKDKKKVAQSPSKILKNYYQVGQARRKANRQTNWTTMWTGGVGG